MAWIQRRPYAPLKVAAFGVVAFVGVACVALLLPRRPSTTEQAIEAKLTELRNRGVPLTPDEVAKLLPDPDPDYDAGTLLAKAIELSRRDSDSVADLPLLGDGQLPKRGEPIPEPMMEAIGSHLSDGVAMEAIPECLDGVRFSLKWNSGSTNPPAHPRFLEIRDLIQTLMLQAIHEAESGNSIGACEALRKGFQIAWTMNDDDLTMTMLRVACANAMCDASEQVLNRIRLTAAQLMELERQIVPERIGDFRNAFVGERVVRLMWFDEERKQYGKRNLRARFTEIVQTLRRKEPPKYRDEDRLLFLNSMDARERALSLPVAICLSTNSSIETEYWQKVKSVAGGENGGLLCGTAIKRAFETRTRLMVLKSVLAIERYRLSNSGATPSRLDDLVSHYLPVVPTDLFHEQPLKYEKRGTGYIVYSIGADGKDNGGKEPAQPSEPEGYDLTVIIEQ